MGLESGAGGMFGRLGEQGRIFPKGEVNFTYFERLWGDSEVKKTFFLKFFGKCTCDFFQFGLK